MSLTWNVAENRAEVNRRLHVCPACGDELAEGRDQFGNPRICKKCSVAKVRAKFAQRDAQAMRAHQPKPGMFKTRLAAALFLAIAFTFAFMVVVVGYAFINWMGTW